MLTQNFIVNARKEIYKVNNIIKKMFIMMVCAITTTVLFSVYAQAFGVKLVKKKDPRTASEGDTKKIALELEYDSTVYGIPLPVDGHLGLELASNVFNKPVYDSGSFSNMTFKYTKGEMLEKNCYECYKDFTVFGNINKKYVVKATVKAKAGTSGRTYMGTGHSTTGYSNYFRTEVK